MSEAQSLEDLSVARSSAEPECDPGVFERPPEPADRVAPPRRAIVGKLFLLGVLLFLGALAIYSRFGETTVVHTAY